MRSLLLAALVLVAAACGNGDGAACHDHHDAQSCSADPACAISGCNDCKGGVNFSQCYPRGTPPPQVLCPAIACVNPCSSATSEDACNQRPDCHAVYQQEPGCVCIQPGCCLRFSACATPHQADCNVADAVCKAATPGCGGDYVPSVAAGCWEGCVHKAECK